MKKLNRAIDRFCVLHPRFGIPNLMLYVVLANIAVFVLDMLFHTGLSSLLCFSTDAVARGEIWRIATFVLIPSTSGMFSLLISCYFYYWIGNMLERQWGTAKFTCYYLGGMLFTLLGTTIASLATGYAVPLYGAGYVNFSLFLAFAALWPDAQVLLFFIIPLKIKYLAYIDLAFFAYDIARYLLGGAWFFAVIPVMALLNFVVFFWEALSERLGGSRAVRAAKSRRQETRERSRASSGVRQCAVCGRTNQTNPELEFRYCSRCAGYHCFCSDHIFSHVHFTDDAP